MNTFNMFKLCHTCHASRFNSVKTSACNTRADRAREALVDVEREKVVWKGGTRGAI